MNTVKRRIFRDQSLERKFRTYGYLILPLVNENERESLLAGYENLKTGKADSNPQGSFTDETPAYREQADLFIKEKLAAKMDEILKGYKIIFSNFMAIEPGPESEVGIHQDWSYLDEEIFSSVNVWLPLTGVREMDGPLHLVPGSHTLPTSIRYSPREEPNWSQHFDLIKEKAVRVDCKKGEAVFFHPGVLHFFPANQSVSPRVAVGLVSNPKDASAIHFFRNRKADAEALEIFEVETSFFYDFKNGERPARGAHYRRRIDYDHLSFTKIQLDSLAGEIENQKSLFSWVKRVIGVSRDE